MVNCIIRRYLKEQQDFEDSELSRIKGDRFHNNQYQLLNDKAEAIYSLDCIELKTSREDIPSNLTFIPCSTYFSRFSEIFPLQLADLEIGWCIPLDAILNRNDAVQNLDDIDNANEALDFATIALIRNLDFIKISHFIGDPDREWTLSDFYEDNLAVVYIDRSKIPDKMLIGSGFNPQILTGLKCMLVTAGYAPIESKEIVAVNQLQPPIDSKVRLRAFSKYLTIESDTILWVISQALSDPSPIGRFLGFYQIIEMLSNKVFEVAVRVIYQLTLIKNPDYHRLNRTLAWISVRWRHARWIVEDFCTLNTSGSNFTDECNQFMYSLDPESKRFDHCWQALYGLRNHIIHADPRWRPSAEKELKVVNAVLIDLIREIMSTFSISKGESELEKYIGEKLVL